MKSSFFVDDFICGAPNYAAAQKIATEATTIAAEAGMPLRRWRTNDPKLQGELLRLQPEDIDKTSDTLEFQDDEMKVLGTGWRRSSDSLGFSTNALIEYCNSVRHRSCLRTVLSVAAHVYDLLGLISPVTIAVRILMQSIWMLRLKWDEEVPAHIKQEFWSWVDQRTDYPTLRFLDGTRADWKGNRQAYNCMCFVTPAQELTVRWDTYELKTAKDESLYR